eukprot:EG_transcript_44428
MFPFAPSIEPGHFPALRTPGFCSQHHNSATQNPPDCSPCCCSRVWVPTSSPECQGAGARGERAGDDDARVERPQLVLQQLGVGDDVHRRQLGQLVGLRVNPPQWL